MAYARYFQRLRDGRQSIPARVFARLPTQVPVLSPGSCQAWEIGAFGLICPSGPGARGATGEFAKPGPTAVPGPAALTWSGFDPAGGNPQPLLTELVSAAILSASPDSGNAVIEARNIMGLGVRRRIGPARDPMMPCTRHVSDAALQARRDRVRPYLVAPLRPALGKNGALSKHGPPAGA